MIQAADKPFAAQSEAWGQLVRNYRPAILGFFRRSPLSRDADDMTQEFLLRSMRDDWWSRADPAVGSFRPFLLVLLKRFVMQERGAGHRRFEVGEAANAVDQRPHWQTPERQFDLDFAACLADETIAQLRNQYGADGRSDLFSALVPFIAEPPEHGELAHIGDLLSISPNTLAVQLKRLRLRFQKHIKSMLFDLSIDEQHAAADMDALRQVLSSGRTA